MNGRICEWSHPPDHRAEDSQGLLVRWQWLCGHSTELDASFCRTNATCMVLCKMQASKVLRTHARRTKSVRNWLLKVTRARPGGAGLIKCFENLIARGDPSWPILKFENWFKAQKGQCFLNYTNKLNLANTGPFLFDLYISLKATLSFYAFQTELKPLQW